MWRSSFILLRPLVKSAACGNLTALRSAEHRIPPHPLLRFFSSSSPEEPSTVTFEETKRLMRLVNVDGLKRRLERDGDEVIGYDELLTTCEAMGVARSKDEAAKFARTLDDAGVILLFRDKVYLHPHKVVDVVSRALPVAAKTDSEDDPRREELKQLQTRMEEIDKLAHKQVRRILWSGLGFIIVQVGLFFRLTFWEYSWDVMEPIAFFTSATGLLVGYAYFLFTSRDPTYQDFMERLFLSRQKKLVQKRGFDMGRYIELQKQCRTDRTLDKIIGMEHSIQ